MEEEDCSHSRLCLHLIRLFVEVKAETPQKRQMLPLKHQQAAFNSIYLKAQEGMKLPVRPAALAYGSVTEIFPAPPSC